MQPEVNDLRAEELANKMNGIYQSKEEFKPLFSLDKDQFFIAELIKILNVSKSFSSITMTKDKN